VGGHGLTEGAISYLKNGIRHVFPVLSDRRIKAESSMTGHE